MALTFKLFNFTTGAVKERPLNVIGGDITIDVNNTGSGSIVVSHDSFSSEDKKSLTSIFNAWATGVVMYDDAADWNKPGGILEAMVITRTEYNATTQQHTVTLQNAYQYLLKVGPLISRLTGTQSDPSAETSWSSGTLGGLYRNILNASLNPSPKPAGWVVPPFVLPGSASGNTHTYTTSLDQGESAATAIETLRDGDTSNGEELLIRPEWTSAARTDLRYRITVGTNALPHIGYDSANPEELYIGDNLITGAAGKLQPTELTLTHDAEFAHNKIVIAGENVQTANTLTNTRRPALVEVELLGDTALASSVTKQVEARNKVGEYGEREGTARLAGTAALAATYYLGKLIHVRESTTTLGITTKLRCTTITYNFDNDLDVSLDLQAPAARYKTRHKKEQEVSGGGGTGKDTPTITGPPNLEVPDLDIEGNLPPTDIPIEDDESVPDWTPPTDADDWDPDKMTLIQTQWTMGRGKPAGPDSAHSYLPPTLTQEANGQLRTLVIGWRNLELDTENTYPEFWPMNRSRPLSENLDTTGLIQTINTKIAALPATVTEYTTSPTERTREAPRIGTQVMVSNIFVIKESAYIQVTLGATYRTGTSSRTPIFRQSSMLLRMDFNETNPRGILLNTLEELPPVQIQNVDTDKTTVALFKGTWMTGPGNLVGSSLISPVHLSGDKWLFCSAQLVTNRNPVTNHTSTTAVYPNYQLDYLALSEQERHRTVDFIIGDFETSTPYFEEDPDIIKNPSPPAVMRLRREYWNTATNELMPALITLYHSWDIWHQVISEQDDKLVITPTPITSGFQPEVTTNTTIKAAFEGRFSNDYWVRKIRKSSWMYNRKAEKMSRVRRNRPLLEIETESPPNTVGAGWTGYGTTSHIITHYNKTDILYGKDTEDNVMSSEDESSTLDIVNLLGGSAPYTGETAGYRQLYTSKTDRLNYAELRSSTTGTAMNLWTPDQQKYEARRFPFPGIMIDEDRELWIGGQPVPGRTSQFIPRPYASTQDETIVSRIPKLIRQPLGIKADTARLVGTSATGNNPDKLGVILVGEERTKLFGWGNIGTATGNNDSNYKPIRAIYQTPDNVKIKQILTTTNSPGSALEGQGAVAILLDNDEVWMLGLFQPGTYGVAEPSLETPKKTNIKAIQLITLQNSAGGAGGSTSLTYVNTDRQIYKEGRLVGTGIGAYKHKISGTTLVKSAAIQNWGWSDTIIFTAPNGYLYEAKPTTEPNPAEWTTKKIAEDYSEVLDAGIYTNTTVGEGRYLYLLKGDGKCNILHKLSKDAEWQEVSFTQLNEKLDDGESYTTIFPESQYARNPLAPSTDTTRTILGKIGSGRVISSVENLTYSPSTAWPYITGARLGEDDGINFGDLFDF